MNYEYINLNYKCNKQKFTLKMVILDAKFHKIRTQTVTRITHFTAKIVNHMYLCLLINNNLNKIPHFLCGFQETCLLIYSVKLEVDYRPSSPSDLQILNT